MEIRINQPHALHETGGRTNNEDSIFPLEGTASPSNRFFLVCDGIGGHQGGEIASRIICESFAVFLEKQPDVFDKNTFDRALSYAYDQLDKADPGGSEKKMGTTLTFLYFHKKGAFMAHIGDSRIYHIRKTPEETVILYKSRDHSLVNDLLQAEMITPEEAENHPRKNVITRAMQPNQEKRGRAEIHETRDIREGDYFFLCSDGILEQVNDAFLTDLISSGSDNKEKMAAVYEACNGKSRDNFSAYLISVRKVLEKEPEEDFFIHQSREENDPMLFMEQLEYETRDRIPENRTENTVSSGKKWIYFLLFLLILLLVGGGYWYTKKMEVKKQHIEEVLPFRNKITKTP